MIRPLYVMAKVPFDVLPSIPIARADPRRLDRLHLTLLPLGDRLRVPGLLEAARAALAAFDAAPFRVVFDRVHGSDRTVALRGSEAMQGAHRLQAQLRAYLLRCGIPLPRYVFRPHITLAYEPDHRGAAVIDAISWQVRDICLIESVHGEGRHRGHGRRLLREAAVPDWPDVGHEHRWQVHES